MTRIVDFLPSDLSASPSDQVVNVQKKIASFLLDYFSSPTSISSSEVVFPIYFQYSGHSRMIVGIETTSSSSNNTVSNNTPSITIPNTPTSIANTSSNTVENMLVFDPAMDSERIQMALLQKETKKWRSFVCRSIQGTLKDSKYQMIVLLPRLMTPQETERSKLLRGELI